MKKNITLIITVCVAIALFYSIPWILLVFDCVPYSYGPVGFVLGDYWFGSNNTKLYYFYCFLTPRAAAPPPDDQTSFAWYANALVIVHFLLVPATLFIIHTYLLWANHESTKFLRTLHVLNPRQYFILKTGRLGLILFFIQILNFLKFTIGLFN